MLHWDMSAMMPSGGAGARTEQLSALNLVCHDMITDPALKALLDQASEETELDDWQAANLHEMRRQWIHANALKADLVDAMTRANAKCEQIWRSARKDKDFNAVLPALEEVLNLARQAGEAKAQALGVSTYDALLDEYEPDGRSAEIDQVFDEVVKFLPDLTSRILEAQAQRGLPRLPEGPFPTGQQQELAKNLMKVIGFDFDHGRLDISAHPFCGGVPDDVRITTRYDEHDFTKALMGVIHETGHALYERGLPENWRAQPVGQARGMSLHESQSLLMEMQACRSAEFLHFAAPMMKAAFSGDGDAWTPDNLKQIYTKVERGFIRVDADEVTYPAHVILRYRLEKALIGGEMKLADLPSAWSEGMRDLLGVVPPDDGVGCLQDIHWYDGAWGYFPTYTLGAMSAAQLFAAANEADPTIRPAIARGDFGPLLTWLRAHIHGKGSSRSTKEILVEATGKPLDPQVFRKHLEDRYLAA